MLHGIRLSTGELDLLAVLVARGPLPQADLARAAGRSTATVSRALVRLRRAGLVRERPTESVGRGRPPRMVELRPDAASVIGIDAGGSMLRAVRADLEGNVLVRATRQARDTRDASMLLADMVDLAREVLDDARDPGLLGVVAGVSGIVAHREGRVLVSPDLPGLEGVALAEALEARLGVPAGIDNDDLLAAIGEASHGAARGCRDVAFLSFGYGLGAGLIVDGRPVRGASSAAGAVAFLASGRFERRASGREIPLRFAEACAAAGRPPSSPGLFDARDVFDMAAAGDDIARAVVGAAVGAIAEAVVDVAAMLDPEVIVLGGGLVSGDGPVLAAVESRISDALPYPPRVAVSALEGGAVLQGAVSMALALGRRGLPTRGRPTPAPAIRVAALELP